MENREGQGVKEVRELAWGLKSSERNPPFVLLSFFNFVIDIIIIIIILNQNIPK